jgi:hypothetical protein
MSGGGIGLMWPFNEYLLNTNFGISPKFDNQFSAAG